VLVAAAIGVGAALVGGALGLLISALTGLAG